MGIPASSDLQDLEQLLQAIPDLFQKDQIKAARSNARAQPPSYSRDMDLASFDKIEKDASKAEEMGRKLAREAQDPTFKERVKQKIGEAANTPVGRTLIGGANTVLHALDYADQKLVRVPEAMAMGMDPKLAWDSSTFHRVVDKRASQGYEAAGNYKTFKNVLSLGTGEIFDRAGYPNAGNFVRDFAHDAIVSPLNLIGMGAPARTSIKVASRLLRGLDEAKAATALKNIAAISSKEFTPHTFTKIAQELRAAGVQPEHVARAFGEKGERLARGQLEVGAGKFKINPIAEVGNAIGGKGAGEFLAGKAKDVIAQPLQNARRALGEARGTKAGGIPGFSPSAPRAGETLSQEAQRLRFQNLADREARTIAHEETAKIFSQAKVAQAARKGLSNADVERLWRDIIDPKEVYTIFGANGVPVGKGLASPSIRAAYAAKVAALTPAERAYVDATTKFFRDQEPTIKKILGPNGLKFNDLSGHYVPRPVGGKSGDAAWDLVAQVLYRDVDAQGLPARLKPRTAQRPWGDRIAGPQGSPDTAKLYAAYAKQVGDALGHVHLADELRSFERVAQTGNLSPEAKAFLASKSPLRSSVDAASSHNMFLQALERWNSTWKNKMLPAFPGYWIRNIAEDTAKMFNAGMNNPKHFGRMDKILNDAEKGDPAARRLVQIMTEHGVFSNATRRFEDTPFGGVESMANDLAKEAGQDRRNVVGKVVENIGTLGGLTEKAPAWMLINRKAGDWWDARSRGALFLDGIEKGLSPKLAAERTTSTLIDYGKRLGDADRFARLAMNFPSYTTQAPLSGAKIIAENPNRTRIMAAAARASQPYESKENFGSEAPRWQAERGATFRAPRPVREAVKAVMPKGSVPGEVTWTPYFGAVNDMAEATKLAENLFSGSARNVGRQVAQQMSPAFQASYELGTGRDLLTDDKIGKPWQSIASRNLFNTFAPLPRISGPILDTVVGKVADATGIEGVPDRFSGAFDEVNPNQRETLSRLLLSLSGAQIQTPRHSQGIRNVLDSPEYQDLMTALEKVFAPNAKQREAIRRYGK